MRGSVGLVTALALISLAGCTAGNSAANGSRSATASSSPAGTGSATPPSRSAPVSTHSSAPAPSVPQLAACTIAGMRIAAIRGVGVSQKQYATLRFSNVSGHLCGLSGYAGAQLMAAGKAIGRPASTAGSTGAQLRLAAGRTVTAALSGPSNCNADVSDSVRITLPGASGHVDRALPMRACQLTVANFK